MNHELRLPAYGRELLDIRQRGMRPESIIIVAIDSWDYGKAFARVVLPQDLPADVVNFVFVAGLDVAVVWLPKVTEIARRDAVVRQILKFSPRSLRVIEIACPVGWLWIKSVAHGIELPEFQ